MKPGWEAIHKYPSLTLAALIGAGIWTGSRIPGPASVLLVFVVLALSVLTGVTAYCQASWRLALVRTVSSVLLCLALGALKFSADNSPGVLVPSPGLRDTVVVIGEIADTPVPTGNKLRFPFRVQMIVRGDSALPCTEKGLVTCVGVSDDLLRKRIRYGCLAGLKGVVECFPQEGNPGEFSPRQYYAANGITFSMRVRGERAIRILDSTGGSTLMKEFVLPVRQSILAHIDRDVGGEEGEFLKGLLIGERAGLPPAVRRAFLDSGVAHILAVSGSNVAVVAGTIMTLLTLLRVPRIAGRILAVGGLLLYMYVSGAQPPVVRATIMAIAILISSWLARRVHPLNGVGLAALVMLTIDARQLFDVGFQLSFGAVLSILLLYPPMMHLVRRRGRPTGFLRLLRPLWSLVAVSVAASIGTLPLTAIAFGRLSVVGFLANLAIVPASGASVVLGTVSAALAPLSDWGAGAYAAANRILLMLTIETAELAASVPWATLDLVWFRPLHALPYYAGLACLFCLGHPPLLRRACLGLLGAADLVLLWPSSALADASPSAFRITMIDVGQGDAILIRSPAGRSYLVDAGPPSRDGSAWGTAVVPLLKRLNVDSLDALIVTHMHDDHAGGVEHVRRSLTVCRTIATPEAVPLARRLMGIDSAVVCGASRGKSFGDSTCRFFVLGPDSGIAGGEENANRRSLILKMQAGDVSMLLMGDAEQEEERVLIARYGEFLRSGVVKVGHHGSRAGTCAEFLEAVDADYALISVGRYNRFGHPSRATLERLNAAGVEVLRTDESGAIFLTTDGTSVRQFQWR